MDEGDEFTGGLVAGRIRLVSVGYVKFMLYEGQLYKYSFMGFIGGVERYSTLVE